MRAGIDVGGTFTDLVLWDGAELRTTKVATTPDDQSEGVVAALRQGEATDAELIHGTTVATNALLERRGARTVLLTDTGFEDLIEIGRQDRPSLYDVEQTRVPPLVPAELRFGVGTRDTPGVSAALSGDFVDKLRAKAPAAVAVSTLFSFSEPRREAEIATIVQRVVPDAAISLSSVVAPEFREFERTSTTVINAYLQPVMTRYLERLGDAVQAAGVTSPPTVMRSSGGLIDPVSAGHLPAAVVLSGPAGGVVAAAAFGTALGRSDLVSFDMGGTSTDVCRIVGGRPAVMFERPIGGLPNRMPSVAIHTVGAGGGSVSWVDPGGALRVGPRSAGAVPGPAAYGLGGSEATVTDANVVVGRIAPGSGSALSIDGELAGAAIARLAEELGLSIAATASGVIAVVESHMERAVRVVSVDEGADPRASTLVAFGGAGGLHATALARRLDMAGVIVPPHAGVLSALGLLLAPPRSDVVIGGLIDSDASLDATIDRAARRARSDLATAGSEAVETECRVDVRYRGQSHETSVVYRLGDGWSALSRDFHDAHAERNGFSRPDDPIEIVAVRAAAIGRPALTVDQLPPHRAIGEAARGERAVMVHDTMSQATVWWRPGLEVGTVLIGPAVIEEAEATTYLGPGDRAVVHETGALEISW